MIVINLAEEQDLYQVTKLLYTNQKAMVMCFVSIFPPPSRLCFHQNSFVSRVTL